MASPGGAGGVAGAFGVGIRSAVNTSAEATLSLDTARPSALSTSSFSSELNFWLTPRTVPMVRRLPCSRPYLRKTWNRLADTSFNSTRVWNAEPSSPATSWARER